MRVLIVGDLSENGLAASFKRAFKRERFQVEEFSIYQALSKYIRGGGLGQKLHTFIGVDAWNRKVNRQLAVHCRRFQPEVIFVMGNAPVLYGTLAFVKSIIPDVKVVLYWPDTLVNLEQNQINSAGLYDLFATYSSASINVLRQIGFKEVRWVPFAGDIDFLGAPAAFDGDYQYDVCFVGGYRPEREAALAKIKNEFPGLKMLIRGTDWQRFAQDKGIRKIARSETVVANKFGNLIRSSRINLNVIDDTNYPAANMRFFEIPAAGGLQLSSACPEQESIFLDGQHVLYFRGESEMLEKVEWAVKNPNECQSIRERGHKLVSENNTYQMRVKALFY